jgi:outer membrane receptor for ferrienterochelin and colicin
MYSVLCLIKKNYALFFEGRQTLRTTKNVATYDHTENSQLQQFHEQNNAPDIRILNSSTESALRQTFFL